jgi:hypothetical protein
MEEASWVGEASKGIAVGDEFGRSVGGGAGVLVGDCAVEEMVFVGTDREVGRVVAGGFAQAAKTRTTSSMAEMKILSLMATGSPGPEYSIND